MDRTASKERYYELWCDTTTSSRVLALYIEKISLSITIFTWPEIFYTYRFSLPCPQRERVQSVFLSSSLFLLRKSPKFWSAISVLGFVKSPYPITSNGDGCSQTRREALFGPTDLSPSNQRLPVLSFPCWVRFFFSFHFLKIWFSFLSSTSCILIFLLFGCQESWGENKVEKNEHFGANR